MHFDCFSFLSFNLRKKKTENDKTEVDFCFSYICFSLAKNGKFETVILERSVLKAFG